MGEGERGGIERRPRGVRQTDTDKGQKVEREGATLSGVELGLRCFAQQSTARTHHHAATHTRAHAHRTARQNTPQHSTAQLSSAVLCVCVCVAAASALRASPCGAWPFVAGGVAKPVRFAGQYAAGAHRGLWKLPPAPGHRLPHHLLLQRRHDRLRCGFHARFQMLRYEAFHRGRQRIVGCFSYRPPPPRITNRYRGLVPPPPPTDTPTVTGQPPVNHQLLAGTCRLLSGNRQLLSMNCRRRRLQNATGACQTDETRRRNQTRPGWGVISRAPAFSTRPPPSPPEAKQTAASPHWPSFPRLRPSG